MSALVQARRPEKSGFVNRLLNPAFAIDRRNEGASTSTADDVYCFDRWYALTQTAAVNASQVALPEAGYLHAGRLTQNQAGAQRMGLAQIIEGINCKDLRSSPVTLSGRVRCSAAQPIRYAILEWTGTEDAVTSDVVLDWTSASYAANAFFLAASLTITAVGSLTPTAATWTDLPALKATLGSGVNNVIVFVWTEGTAAQNVTLDLDCIQLEAGSFPSAFERRPLALEGALCERYLPYWRFPDATSDYFGFGFADTTSTAQIMLPHRVEARTQTTGITVSAATHFTMFTSTFTGNSATTAMAFSSGNRQFTLVAATCGVALTAGGGAWIMNNNVAAKILATGCEL